MILVTTGSTMPFDSLVVAIDEAVSRADISEKVICQIGNGSYQPQHCEHFRFQESIDQLIDEASLVITHGGTGTVTDLIKRQKRFIAVANPMGADNHQVEFLAKLATISNFIWTDEPTSVVALLKKSENIKTSSLLTPSLFDDLKTYIKG